MDTFCCFSLTFSLSLLTCYIASFSSFWNACICLPCLLSVLAKSIFIHWKTKMIDTKLKEFSQSSVQKENVHPASVQLFLVFVFCFFSIYTLEFQKFKQIVCVFPLLAIDARVRQIKIKI